MSYLPGIVHVVSLFVLTFVVASVYSLAHEADAPPAHIVRHTLRRAGKLLAVLAVLAVTVHFLGLVR